MKGSARDVPGIAVHEQERASRDATQRKLDATVSAELLAYIKHMGGQIINSFAAARAVSAAVPLTQWELLTARPDVKFPSPIALATTHPIGGA